MLSGDGLVMGWRAHRGMRHGLLPVLALAALLLGACSTDPGSGPIEVEWGHAACRRCNMVLENRHYAAQVRRQPAGAPSEIHLFDDIGCALVWLADKPWKDEPGVEIWVSDHATGLWIDARQAHYVTGRQSPMLYGLGAQAAAADGTLDFEAARARVLAVEARLNQHRAP